MSEQKDSGIPRPIEYYASATPSSSVSVGKIIAWIFGGLAVLLVLGSIVVPSINRHGDPTRIWCASNLRQIGQAIVLYGNDNKGEYPDSFGTMLRDEDISSDVFVCRETNDIPATGPTTQAVIANLATPTHCSYVYLGKGLTTLVATPTTVVVYEPLGNHGGQGMNILWGDGHVDFEAAPIANKILQQVKAGVWPVVYPTNSNAHTKPGQ